MTGKPIMRISAADLDNLMTTLDVTFLKLAECIVSPGWRLAMPASDAPGVHYNLQGWGRIVVGEHAPIELRPHTLVIVPPAINFNSKWSASKVRTPRRKRWQWKLRHFSRVRLDAWSPEQVNQRSC